MSEPVGNKALENAAADLVCACEDVFKEYFGEIIPRTGAQPIKHTVSANRIKGMHELAKKVRELLSAEARKAAGLDK